MLHTPFNIPPLYDDVITWKHYPRHWPFVRGIHRSPMDSLHRGQCRGSLMFSMIFAGTNGWANRRDAGDLRRHRTHYDANIIGIGEIVRLLGHMRSHPDEYRTNDQMNRSGNHDVFVTRQYTRGPCTYNMRYTILILQCKFSCITPFKRTHFVYDAIIAFHNADSTLYLIWLGTCKT